MNFMFEWQEQYLTLFLPREQEIRIFELILLYRHTYDGVFDDFPRISDHFPKILEDSLKIISKILLVY